MASFAWPSDDQHRWPTTCLTSDKHISVHDQLKLRMCAQMLRPLVIALAAHWLACTGSVYYTMMMMMMVMYEGLYHLN